MALVWSLNASHPLPSSFWPGGAEGELIGDLKEYFYYAQIRRQGLSSMVRREVSDRVPIAEVPDIMRAIGFFPTERQIEVCVGGTRAGLLFFSQRGSKPHNAALFHGIV